ncbi:MAG: PTS sugar transporter subunit IIC [Vagococcus salmoninarum]|uniref:PTS sugar transporter subunit IIC n=1 Tax=Vagococcus salmoninarum TaxID=2739 RepID=UPI003F9C130B
MANLSTIQMRVQKFAAAIQRNKIVNAIMNGLMSAMPITIVGALGSLLNGIPIESYQEFLLRTGLKAALSIPTEITTNLLAIYVVFLIAAKYAEAYEVDGTPAGSISLMAFFIITPFTSPEGAFTIEAYPTFWFGAQGLFTSFIVALLAARVYILFMTKGWIIEMPPGVPPTISKSFSSLIPGFIVAIVAVMLRYGLSLTPFEHLHQLIFGLISAPLTQLGTSFTSLVIAALVAQLLWVFGVHGALIVYSVFAGIWAPIGNVNLAAYNAGETIPHLVSAGLFGMTSAMGSGATLGLAIAMLRSKAKQYRVLGKLAIVPNICGINEPLIFGMPIVMNLTLAIPFIVIPLVILIMAYVGMLTGILPRLPGIHVPLGVPIILSGFLQGGWRWAMFQLMTIFISYFGYLPFLMKMDKQAYQNELSAMEN